jgi:hypothetical protein
MRDGNMRIRRCSRTRASRSSGTLSSFRLLATRHGYLCLSPRSEGFGKLSAPCQLRSNQIELERIGAGGTARFLVAPVPSAGTPPTPRNVRPYRPLGVARRPARHRSQAVIAEPHAINGGTSSVAYP